MVEKILEKIGLSEKEVKIYLAILELGQDTIQNIAKKANIQRPTAYIILDSLRNKGLVTTVEKARKTLFAAETPQHLERLLQKSQEDIREKQNELKNIIPELQAIFNLAEKKPKVKFYEGKEGVIAMHEEFLRLTRKGKKDTVGLTPIDELFRVFPDYEETYTKRRAEQGVKSKVIYTSDKGPIARKSTKKNLLREARFVPKSKFPFSSGLSAYGDKYLTLVSYKDQLMGVSIESKELTQSFRSIFELAWEAAKKYN